MSGSEDEPIEVEATEAPPHAAEEAQHAAPEPDTPQPKAQPAADQVKPPLLAGPMFPESTSGIRVMQALSLVLIGALTAITFWQVPPLSETIFDLTGSADPLPIGIGAVVLGLAYTLIVSFLMPASPIGDGGLMRWAVFLVSLFIGMSALAYTSMQLTVLFFEWQALLFAGAIMTYGVVRGRRWAVFSGAMLQMFEAFWATTGPEDLPILLGYGMVFMAALELSYTTAGYSAVLVRELVEADGPRTRALAKSAIDRGAASYAPRIIICILAVALLLGTGTALFLRPGTFGPAYAESIESTSVLAFTLPMLLIILVAVVLLGIPDNAGESLRRAGRRSRNSLIIFGAYVKRKLKGVPDEESTKGFESWETDENGAELETF